MGIALCAFLTIKHPNVDSSGQRLDTVLAYAMGLASLFIFVAIPIIMIKGRTQLEEKYSNHKKRFWVLYEDLDVNNPWIPFYRFVFMFRRILLAYAIVIV